MKKPTPKPLCTLILTLALSLSFTTGAALADSAASPSPTPSTMPSQAPNPLIVPNWLTKPVYGVKLSNKAESRTESEIKAKTISQNILGSDFLKVMHPMSFENFKNLQVLTSPAGSDLSDEALKPKYQKWISEQSVQAAAALSLGRILDNEALKRKVSRTELNPDRVSYVIRSVLIQNAISQKIAAQDSVANSKERELERLNKLNKDPKNVPSPSVPSVCASPAPTSGVSLPKRTPEELAKLEYQLAKDFEKAKIPGLYWQFQNVAKGQPVRLNIDWKELSWLRNEAETLSLYYKIRRAEALTPPENDVPWSPVKIDFEKLPETFAEFETSVKEQLAVSHREMMRRKVWSILIQEYNPFLEYRAMFSVNEKTLDEMYLAQKESYFTYQDKQFDLVEFEFNAISPEQESKMNVWLDAERKRVGAALRALQTEENAREKQLELIRVERQNLPEKFSKFLKDPASGLGFFSDFSETKRSVKILGRNAFLERPISQGQSSGPDSADSEEALSSLLGNAYLVDRQALPVVAIRGKTECGEKSQVYLITRIDPGTKNEVPRTEKKVDQFLTNQIKGRLYGKAAKSLITDLLFENRFYAKTRLCSDQNWVCVDKTLETPNESYIEETLVENLVPVQKIQNVVTGYNLGIIDVIFSSPVTPFINSMNKTQTNKTK